MGDWRSEKGQREVGGKREYRAERDRRETLKSLGAPAREGLGR